MADDSPSEPDHPRVLLRNAVRADGVTVGGSGGLLNCLEDEDLCLSSERLRGKNTSPIWCEE